MPSGEELARIRLPEKEEVRRVEGAGPPSKPERVNRLRIRKAGNG